MIAGAAPSTPEQQQRARRLLLTMVLGESPLIIAGVVCYLLTENWLYFGLCVGAGMMIGVVAVVRFAVQSRNAQVAASAAPSDTSGNPPIVQ
jgi:hypothetical protein